LIQKLGYRIFTTTMCGKMRPRMCSESPERIGRAKKILELQSGKLKAVDTFE
jgi:hypothetical protein